MKSMVQEAKSLVKISSSSVARRDLIPALWITNRSEYTEFLLKKFVLIVILLSVTFAVSGSIVLMCGELGGLEMRLLGTVTLTDWVTLKAEYTALTWTHERTWYGHSARTGHAFIVI
jgi:hypothetical protein